MVNYCCVNGCGRNSRINKHLNFYSLPKDIFRQRQWLKVAKREDLLVKTGSNCRFCSRHFAPSSIRNRLLCADAVPTLYLPGDVDDEVKNNKLTHKDVKCNHCVNPIVGFRYKCVLCKDYDLCQKCEALEAHSEHFMLRIPQPIKFKLLDDLVLNWRKFFKADHVTPDTFNDSDRDSIGQSSDDDIPIQQYKNYDSGVDLPDSVKTKIREEVARALRTNKPVQKKPIEKRQRLKLKRRIKENEKPKKIKNNESSVPDIDDSQVEVAFADVNAEIKEQIDMKQEFEAQGIADAARTMEVNVPVEIPSSSMVVPSLPIEQPMPNIPLMMPLTGPMAMEQQPMMHVKLSDDLTELMIEVTSNNQSQCTVYNLNNL